MPDTEILSASRSPGGNQLVLRVRSTLPRDLRCPFCGKPRRPNGTRTVHFRDAPFRGQPVLIDWKRQQYRCSEGCGRASNEQHAAFDERHFLTRRFVEWLVREGSHRPFVAVAKECGMNERLVRKLFHEQARQIGSDLKSARILAFHNIRLANRDRVAVIDIESKKFLDVFASSEALAEDFALVEFSDSPAGRHVEVLVVDVALLASPPLSRDYFKRLFPGAQLLVSGVSVVREVNRLLADAARPLLASCASAESSTAKSALALFLRERHNLGAHARKRLNHWKESTPDLYEIFQIKDRLTNLIKERKLSDDTWRAWKIDAISNSPVVYRPVIELVESHWDELTSYQATIEMIFFEEWFQKAISNLDVHGAHSFAAARVAFLESQNSSLSAKP